MKASKFYPSFKTLLDSQEKKLSTISEVIDSLLGVQRKWIYLENIFMAGGDIAKQLPSEFNLFVQVCIYSDSLYYTIILVIYILLISCVCLTVVYILVVHIYLLCYIRIRMCDMYIYR